MSLKNIGGNKVWLGCTFLFFIVLTLLSIDVPFFWDSVTFSKIAVHFYENGFSGLIVPKTSDTGGFPLYGAYIALCWMLFGKSLWVSHLMFLPFLLGVVWEFYKICKRFLPAHYIPAALLLLVAEPCLATQGMLMAYDVILLYFLLLAANSLAGRKHFLYSLSLVFVVLISVRGIFAIPAFALIHTIIVLRINKRKVSAADILIYLPSVFVFVIWILWHKQQTGWYLLSPLLDATDQKTVGVAMMLRQFIYIIWKIADFGRIALWMAIAVLFFVFRKQIKGIAESRILMLFLLLPLLLNMLFMIPISNPIGHRYFLFTYIILIITFTYIIQFIGKRIITNVLIAALLAVMISGNIWLWPEKYGNGWDCSLKVIPFFSMEQQFRSFVIEQHIEPSSIATDFPLQADVRNTRLHYQAFAFSDKRQLPLSSFKYIMHSNISNKFSPAEMHELEQHWQLVYHEEQWPVYIRLYRNPQFQVD